VGGREVTFSELARDPREVVAGLYAWQRGERGEAVRQTLAASARETHARHYTLWVWTGVDDAGRAVWALPVASRHAQDFAPKGPAKVLVRCLAAAIDAGADPAAVHLRDWHGWVVLEVPGADPDLAALALADAHPTAARVAAAPLPEGVPGGPPALDLGTGRPDAPGGLPPLAAAVHAHPVEVAIALASHGQPLEAPAYDEEMVGNLRNWGLSREPDAEEPEEVPMGIDDDPCPRRRHARRVLQRLLRMGKVGTNYHTEIDHLYRGAPADQRRDAMEVGEALVRAGLLGEKPSVGQRHVYLRRDALPAIHALIERGETDSPLLNAMWTAPPPGG
jgi:hypothetical protein